MNGSVRILSPCGMLGYGFPAASFLKGLEYEVHGIVVDAGSTDAGPHKLGAGVPIVSRRAAKKDLELLLIHGLPKGIPIVIGSAGGAGAKPHVDWTLEIIYDILEEHDLSARLAVIPADLSQELVLRSFTKPLSPNIPPLNEETVLGTQSIVAQMGHEPIVEALKNRAEIIVCGRAYDPSPFAAVGLFYGKDPGLSYHLGKILECGALCAEPGTTKDCILGTLTEDSFTVEALSEKRRCTPISVAAHTFYEKEHPYLLHGPGFVLDLEHCTFEEKELGIVEVRNSRFLPAEDYFVKLEGARKVAYRTFVIAGIRDPLLLERLEQVEEEVKRQTAVYFEEIPQTDYTIRFMNYGMSGVLGEKEQTPFTGHEAAVLFEVTARTQELASTICAAVRSTFLHYGYEGRKSTAGNLAFPFAPSDIEFGPVYEFSIYHLMKTSRDLFSVRYEEVRHGRPL
ncbi:acyclic terpene utilization AtuA family protein [Bacillus mangrovi]|uniref:Acyclic terpene utilization AtuA family protein n=1 Tax=Metabacillus mangrovi TaxID=1491830 RepID=A0A7X2S6J5_9BACI|nr:acyclic terpene utilization AtuA family protein [Metabacillus mangrovi]MTH53691.1 acyclic terpene utilization AtuA family protein [Metabacillus mangrovi]